MTPLVTLRSSSPWRTHFPWLSSGLGGPTLNGMPFPLAEMANRSRRDPTVEGEAPESRLGGVRSFVMAHGTHAASADHGDHPTFWRRWFYSTNHKDIGTLYLIFGFTAGIIGGLLSIAMRLELQQPGLQFFSNPQAFNVFVTGHGLIMVFFVIMPTLIGGFG